MKNVKKEKFGGKKEIAIVNSITGLRFLASFLVVPIFKALGGISAAIFSAIFLLTDAIDGKLARKWKVSTFFGSIFDGATDKAFCIMALGILMAINPLVFSIPLLMELGILIVQNKKMHKGLNVKSNFIGKVKMWALSLSTVGSMIAVDLLNMPFILDYIKNAALDKVVSIKEFLILLGINLPAIIFQALTLRSYSKESKEDVIEDKKEENIDLAETKEFPLVRLQEISEERQKLEEEYTFLEKAKIIGEKLFDPEYYAENKDRQIRVLTKELFNKRG